VLRTHADICKGAVEVRIERQALKDHAAIFDGAADEIERLQRERDDLYRANVDLATRLAHEPKPEASKELCRLKFDEFAADLGLCMDEIFMSSHGVPENPFDDTDTNCFYRAWLASWKACEAARTSEPACGGAAVNIVRAVPRCEGPHDLTAAHDFGDDALHCSRCGIAEYQL
jgi:hypothetical protein